MQRLLPILFILCCGTSTILAQHSVSGTVTDDSGKPLSGTVLRVKGSDVQATTDSRGQFSLELPDGASKMIATHEDYGSRKVRISGDTTLDLSLARLAGEQEMITALGNQRAARSLGYAAYGVRGEELAGGQENRVVSALTGRAPGARIDNSNSGMSGSSRLLLRGTTSLTGPNRPLFVVDGVPMLNDNNNGPSVSIAAGGRDYGNTLQDINPADVATVTFLNGGVAAGLYGSRGSNGAVIITTKTGVPGEGVRAGFNSAVSFSQVASLPDYQNQYGGGRSQEFDVFAYNPRRHPETWNAFEGQLMPDYGAEASWGPEMTGQMVRHWDSWYPGESFGELREWSPNPDNVQNFYEGGIAFDNNFYLSGGTDQSTFRMSYTNHASSGVFPESSLDRNSISLKASQQIGQRFSATLNANYVNTFAEGRPAIGAGGFGDPTNVQTTFNQWFQRQLDIDRLREYQSEDGTPRTWNIRQPGDTRSLAWESPFWVVNEDRSEDSRDRLYGGLTISYQLRPGLSLAASARNDYYSFRATEHIAPFSSANLPYHKERSVASRENNLELIATYAGRLGEDFTVESQVGGNLRRESYRSGFAQTKAGLDVPGVYTIENSVERPERNDLIWRREVKSIFGRVGLGWRSTFYLDLAARNEQTSALETGYDSNLYPSVSTSFVFSELLNSGFMTHGKLRAGVAMLGNDPGPYRTRTTYSATSFDVYVPTYTLSDRQGNPGLLAESVMSWEAGMDLRFLSDRLGLSLTYYTSESTNLIIDRSLGGTTGFSSRVSNAGAMTNQGLELQLQATPLTRKRFVWNTQLNLAANQNQVTALAEGQEEIVIGSYRVDFVARPGAPFGTLVGMGYQRDAEGRKLIDAEGLPVLADNLDLGSVNADYTGGIFNEFAFGRLRLAALVDFRMGGVIYSESNRWGTYSGQLATTVGTNANGVDIRQPVSDGGGILVEGVTADGNPNETYVDAQRYFEELTNFEEEFTYDASFVKLRELSLGYDLPLDKLARRATVSLFARNALTLYQVAPNIDPENSLTNESIRGYENGQNPSVRTVGLRLSAEF